MSDKFWTREAPKEPGWYWAIFNYEDEIETVYVNRRLIAEVAGYKDGHDLQSFKYWSREPIRFPEPPKEQGDE